MDGARSYAQVYMKRRDYDSGKIIGCQRGPEQGAQECLVLAKVI